jgi:hypothetical protein
MDRRPDTERPAPDESQPTARFRRLAEDDDSSAYPMLTPAPAHASGEAADLLDEQILAGLVNL